MTDIRYVCLSDMHLGAQNSLLTNLKADGTDTDPAHASRVLSQLVECVRELIAKNENKDEKPTLILAGDILELALTTDDEAAMAFERFIELICPGTGALFKEIKYIPGNHDHHLWETARETQYVRYIASDPAQVPGSKLKVPWHATSMFIETPHRRTVPSVFLDGIINRYPQLRTTTIDTVYPNLGLISNDRRRGVIVTHGHFTESMYMLMTTARRLMFPNSPQPSRTWDFEAENFAWIDFFWSTMGRSGEVGTDVEIIYDKLQDPGEVQKLAFNLALGLVKKLSPSRFRNLWEGWLFRRVLKTVLTLAANAERSNPEELLSAAGLDGLRYYIEGPVLDQVKGELTDDLPSSAAVVFGHTHKPFQKDMDFQGFHPGVKVYNTGGWVVDTVKRQPLHGGAVILVDEHLNVASLRMYNETEERGGYQVNVQASTHPNDDSNALYDRLKDLIDPTQDPWMTFSEEVYAAIPLRVENLKSKIKK